MPSRRSTTLTMTTVPMAAYRIVAPTATAWVTTCCGLPSSSPEYAAWTVVEAKTPVAMAPNMPPTPCTAKTSSASSTRDRGGSSDVGDCEGAGGQAAGGQRGAGVEPEPAEPQQPGAEHDHRDVVRLLAVPVHVAPADHQRDDERGHARADVDDRAAREVERAELVQPAVGRPDPVGDRRVDEDRPQDREEHERAEALPLGERARDQRRRDRREHELEHGEQHERDRHGVDGRWNLTDAVEEREVEAPDEAEAVDVRPER